MKLQGIEVGKLVESVKKHLSEDDDIPSAFKSIIEVLLIVVSILLNRLGLNSQNSSKPPSTDPNREKTKKGKSKNKPGGQPGRIGTTLEKVEDPDEIELLKVDKGTLPRGREYRLAGFETRQVFDFKISRHVKEYRAEVLEDDLGNRYVAPFPGEAPRAVQYGPGVKAHAVYMSQQQLIPYDRVRDHFQEQILIPVSAGSVFNFNQEAYEKLESFDTWVKDKLAMGDVLQVDETGINIDGKGHWLHSASSDTLTYFSPHSRRGKIAMDEIGILPRFRGTLIHDHWKVYFQYTDCDHALCNAHHLRELECAWEQDDQGWAKKMKKFLVELNKKVDQAGGQLSEVELTEWREKYREILTKAETECPPPAEKKEAGKRGRQKRSKSRNLLERLRDFEKETLRFMEDPRIPFTNNTSENDLRMTKVQQKISGCFRSVEGAQIFCRVRSYLSTCRKQGLTSTEALRLLFEGKKPAFMGERAEESRPIKPG